MIDNLSLILFGALMVYVVYKAAALDKTLPWFGLEKKEHKRKNRTRNQD